ncbi:hypothetical protein AKJ16_DCAP01342 [Drosera capensis]
MPTTSSSDEWVLIKDDDLVYKRRKRHHPTRPRPIEPAPDLEAEERERRERKRKALVKLRDKYRREIGIWDELVKKLGVAEKRAREEEEKVENQNQNPMQKRMEGEVGVVGREYGELIDGIFVKVNAQEAIIANLTALCDVAEALCAAHEEKVAQSFLDLPIWRSPRELMSSLCED